MQTTLPIPNPQDWIDTYAAATLLGVDPSTVLRMRPEVLTQYRIGRTRVRLYWRPQVVQLAAAKRLLTGRTDA